MMRSGTRVPAAGAATAIALYCIEKGGMHGVLHSAARKDVQFANQMVLSRSRKELLATTGSLYVPASPCDGLFRFDQSGSQCAFIGKHYDVAGVQMARKRRPVLEHGVGVTLAFFCAGVPSTKGTLELLKQAGVENPASVPSLRYRDNGWPGLWTVNYTDENGLSRTKQMTYSDSWGFLQRYRQWRCYVCSDHTGEFVDIAVGDLWYREIQPGEFGRSLIVARTKRGLDIIEAAEACGYFTLEKCDPELLPLSQPNLLSTRGTPSARLKVLRLLGAAVPNYQGFELFRYWRSELALRQKIQSVIGTIKRVFTNRLRQKVNVEEWYPEDNSSRRWEAE